MCNVDVSFYCISNRSSKNLKVSQYKGKEGIQNTRLALGEYRPRPRQMRYGSGAGLEVGRKKCSYIEHCVGFSPPHVLSFSFFSFTSLALYPLSLTSCCVRFLSLGSFRSAKEYGERCELRQRVWKEPGRAERRFWFILS